VLESAPLEANVAVAAVTLITRAMRPNPDPARQRAARLMAKQPEPIASLIFLKGHHFVNEGSSQPCARSEGIL
jgi:hypothetical protein